MIRGRESFRSGPAPKGKEAVPVRRTLTLRNLLSPRARSFAAMSPPSILWIDTPGTALQVRMKSLAVRFGDGRERHFPRGKHSLRSIILHAPDASVTIEAARWAVDEGTALVRHWLFLPITRLLIVPDLHSN
jgi:hypothetical protein